jgi:hypothetical protein
MPLGSQFKVGKRAAHAALLFLSLGIGERDFEKAKGSVPGND